MSSAISRDPFFPTPPKGRGPALGLALLAHGLLLLALALGVNWRTAQPPTLAAELWSAVPQAAAPRATEPPPPPPEPSRPQPVAKAAPPKPEPQMLPDPQIAIEKAKRDEAKRLKAEQQDKLDAKREKAERDKAEKEKQKETARLKDEAAQKKALAEKQKAEKQKVELAKAEQADAAREKAIREQNLKRLQGLAGASGGPGDAGTALRSSGPSASYAGRIVARIKPNIVFSDAVAGNPVATIEVTLAPDGTIVGRKLVKSSGVKAWDDAVLRAIERTGMLPRDTDGSVPRPFNIEFKPND